MTYLLAIPLLPALVFPLFFVLPRAIRNRLLFVPIGAMGVSLALSVVALLSVWPGGHELADHPAGRIEYAIGMIDGAPLNVIVQLDALGAMMLIVITFVAFCVELYSLSYMHGEERIGWYYTVLSLFTSAMLLLVLAGDFLLFYMSWEVMGLCSYLLIGFWNTDLGARRAAMKAFLVTRVGDVGFAIALAVMWTQGGTLEMAEVFHAAEAWAPGIATLVALLLLFGAMGKSAQVPLHMWLPDAMAGPTPASALIHAATMVAAGVFLVARSLPIFEVSGVALTVVLWIGGSTAFLAATMAAVQHNIKKVLAYSTISQLGYMFLGLGAGSATAALFHLFTHAFFKSLLFLGAGSIIHALHTQDMREIDGIGKSMKVTTVTFTIGTLALSGIAPFSGFFSKDLILDHLLAEGHYVSFAFALLTAGLTAFYMARLWFRVFPESRDRCRIKFPHESDAKMLGPMVFLATLAAASGFAVIVFGDFIGHAAHWPKPGMAALTTGVAVVGILLGWALFRDGRTPDPLKQRFPRAYGLVVNKYYADLLTDEWVAGGYDGLSKQVNWFDKYVINGIVNGVGVACRNGGTLLRRVQAGRIQGYQRLLVGGLFLFVLVAVARNGGM
jgi:NADH-quinone oxidoreductase subunit L